MDLTVRLDFSLAGFKFAARTLLELGKELISSDEVALYELIKNGIDAGSSRIEIEARIVLTHSAYGIAIDSLDEGVPPGAVLSKITEESMQDSGVSHAASCAI